MILEILAQELFVGVDEVNDDLVGAGLRDLADEGIEGAPRGLERAQALAPDHGLELVGDEHLQLFGELVDSEEEVAEREDPPVVAAVSIDDLARDVGERGGEAVDEAVDVLETRVMVGELQVLLVLGAGCGDDERRLQGLGSGEGLVARLRVRPVRELVLGGLD